MPEMKFDDIKEQELVPAGLYLAQVAASEETESQAGNTMFKLRWQIIVDSEGNEDHANRVIFDNLVFAFQSDSPVPLRRVKQALSSLGWDKSFTGDVEAEELIGKVALIGVGQRPSSGTDEQGEPYPPQNNVRNYKRPASEMLANVV